MEPENEIEIEETSDTAEETSFGTVEDASAEAVEQSTPEILEETSIIEGQVADPTAEIEVAEPTEVPEEVEKRARPLNELVALVEALIFVADEPVTVKLLAEVLKEDKESVDAAVRQLQQEYEERDSGLQVREIAGGWQLATRTELHDEIRQFLKTRPSAKLSIAALETLAVIAYKQPVTVPEILEIRGVQSASAIKTLLEKRLIVTKGHKETVGKPMQYGTSKEFLIQFGLRDLSELPSIEDFEDLVS
jgi:segregation and condensation protein B